MAKKAKAARLLALFAAETAAVPERKKHNRAENTKISRFSTAC
jgi:hypothetical protein